MNVGLLKSDLSVCYLLAIKEYAPKMLTSSLHSRIAREKTFCDPHILSRRLTDVYLRRLPKKIPS